MSNLTTNDFTLLIALHNQGAVSTTTAITIKEIGGSIPSGAFVPISLPKIVKRCIESGVIAPGMKIRNANTYYLTQSGSQLVQSELEMLSSLT